MMARAAKEPWLVILSSAVKEQKIADWRAFCEYFNGRNKKFTSIQTAWRGQRGFEPPVQVLLNTRYRVGILSLKNSAQTLPNQTK
jgi:hypothetical protein